MASDSGVSVGPGGWLKAEEEDGTILIRRLAALARLADRAWVNADKSAATAVKEAPAAGSAMALSPLIRAKRLTAG
jgi:hypothetical protein